MAVVSILNGPTGTPEAPGALSGLTVVTTAGGVYARWPATPRATSYEVASREAGSGDPFTVLDTTSERRYSVTGLTGGTEVELRVTPRNGLGDGTPGTQSATAGAPGYLPPPVVEIFGAPGSVFAQTYPGSDAAWTRQPVAGGEILSSVSLPGAGQAVVRFALEAIQPGRFEILAEGNGYVDFVTDEEGNVVEYTPYDTLTVRTDAGEAEASSPPYPFNESLAVLPNFSAQAPGPRWVQVEFVDETPFDAAENARVQAVGWYPVNVVGAFATEDFGDDEYTFGPQEALPRTNGTVVGTWTRAAGTLRAESTLELEPYTTLVSVFRIQTTVPGTLSVDYTFEFDDGAGCSNQFYLLGPGINVSLGRYGTPDRVDAPWTTASSGLLSPGTYTVLLTYQIVDGGPDVGVTPIGYAAIRDLTFTPAP